MCARCRRDSTSQRAGLRQGHAPWAALPSSKMTLRRMNMGASLAKRGDYLHDRLHDYLHEHLYPACAVSLRMRARERPRASGENY